MEQTPGNGMYGKASESFRFAIHEMLTRVNGRFTCLFASHYVLLLPPNKLISFRLLPKRTSSRLLI